MHAHGLISNYGWGMTFSNKNLFLLGKYHRAELLFIHADPVENQWA
jgi:ribosome biogenesis protein Tsr3